MRSGSQIFELFGYPVDSWSEKANRNLMLCNCPFMNSECDGGGNRFSSGIDLNKNRKLKPFFPRKKVVQAGVCSLQLKSGEQPWIVCPRRLLNYRSDSVNSVREKVREELHRLSGLKKGARYSVWSEVKMKCDVSTKHKASFFDYTFDYVIAGSTRKPMAEIAALFGKSESAVKMMMEAAGRTTTYRDGKCYCDDFPSAPFVIVEVMTSSTSGGNKRKRTQIGQLFEDTVYKLAGKDVEPAGPGINYRQVWARMVSQLLVKSQIGMRWGGSTFWVLQDLLVDYISKTTGLDLADFIAEHKDEVNILSGGYGKNVKPENRNGDFADIDDVMLLAGPVSASKEEGKSFSDIVKLGGLPDVAELWKHLAAKSPCASFTS